jgi:hypothetical protein
MVSMSAAVICGRSGGPPNAVTAVLQGTTWRLLQEFLARALRRFTAKWCIPEGFMVDGDGGSIPVERTKDLMVFLFFVLDSFVYLCWVLLYFSLLLRV